MVKLTDEQIAAVKQNPEGVSCEDSTTHRLYFIVDEHFHRRALLALRQQHDLSAIRQAVGQMEAGTRTPLYEDRQQLTLEFLSRRAATE